MIIPCLVHDKTMRKRPITTNIYLVSNALTCANLYLSVQAQKEEEKTKRKVLQLICRSKSCRHIIAARAALCFQQHWLTPLSSPHLPSDCNSRQTRTSGHSHSALRQFCCKRKDHFSTDFRIWKLASSTNGHGHTPC